jgi:hypothetical protein
LTLKIAFLGDICLTGKFDLMTNPEARSQFQQVKEVLARYDLVIANLESPLTEKNSSLVCKAIHIKSPSVNVSLLQYLGVNAVSLANNHIFDYGREGYEETVTALQTAGIEYFGTHGRQIILEKGQDRLMLGGFCCLSAHPSAANSQGVNVLKPESFMDFLASAHAQNAFPIASVHWGDENIHYPREDHVYLARMAAAKYGFLLHGHHPHVIQGLERCRGALIAYSLGNFCTDEHISRSIRNLTVRHTPENQQSYILGITMENGMIQSHEVIPIADAGDCLAIQGRAALDQILTYSAGLGAPDKSYRRLATRPNSSVPADPTASDRFSLPWFMQRMNYYFIGAFLKGIINRIRYRHYFFPLRK